MSKPLISWKRDHFESCLREESNVDVGSVKRCKHGKIIMCVGKNRRVRTNWRDLMKWNEPIRYMKALVLLDGPK